MFVRLLIPLVILALPLQAFAGWMGFRNDTTGTVVVQETVTTGKTTRHGKPQKVFINETIRDTPGVGQTVRTFVITDGGKPEKTLYRGQFNCPASHENVLFILKSDGRGGLLLETVRQPATVAKSQPKK